MDGSSEENRMREREREETERRKRDREAPSNAAARRALSFFSLPPLTLTFFLFLLPSPLTSKPTQKQQ